MALKILLAALALISLALTLWRFVVAMRFPLHHISTAAGAPAITLLKPLKDFDAETVACLQSWLEQDYPGPVQILFGVHSAEDPVCGIVRELMAQGPDRDVQLVVCRKRLGANAKVSTLVQLEPLARHEVIIISDADVRVPPGFLTQVVSPLQTPDVGLVSCFYRLANPANLAMRWEAAAINGDFWSQVLQSRSMHPLNFALGAVMATTRAQLVAIGGFRSLADHLADDYHLGNLIASRGGRIALCSTVVECRSSPMSWRQVWSHQLRWARTIRFCQPVPYFFSILGNATFWPLLCLIGFLPAVAGVATRWSLGSNGFLLGETSVACAGLLVAFCLLTRIFTALLLQKRFTGSCAPIADGWLVPLNDLLQALIWALAFLGNRVVWRGRRYRVLRGGKLEKI